jgi:hypothetical protein
MMFRAAIFLIAFASPVFAQHGATHGGSFGSRGFAGHVGYSEHRGSSQPNRFVRPGQPLRVGALGGAGLRGNGPLNHSGLRNSYNGSRFMAARSAFNSRDAGLSRSRDRDRVSFAARRRSFENWYAHIYPTWFGYGYPYGIDPGFYDSDDFYSSANEQAGAPPDYPAPYADEGYGAPNQQPASAGPTAPSASSSEQPLTVVFNTGRAPVRVQNYMMTAKVLTDLDSQHYEQFPLDQIDLAATQRVNSAVGVEFQIPSASRD